jgi:glycosyltransferase involved in cell wall biosynthesis
MQSVPKISIITVVYNGVALLERTINSVLVQTYPHIEYIIIDGASTDGTLDIVEKYKSKIQIIISEKDKGIYYAMNKGLAVATGDYVLFLNAGDELYAESTITNVFSNSMDADVYYGNTAVVDEQRNLLGDRRLTPPENLTWESFKFGMSVSHQSFIAKRSLCDFYNLNYRLGSDIDWVINILKKSKKIVYVKIYISKFLEGGVTSKKRIKAWTERFQLLSKHYGVVPTLWNHLYIAGRFLIHKFTHTSMT